MKTSSIIVTGLVVGLTVACAHAPPNELVEARAAYKRAEGGPAAKYDPAGLHVAKESLNTAEKRFEDDWKDPIVRDQAYIAQRKVEYSEVTARIQMLQRGIAESEALESEAKDKSAARTKAELDATKAALASEKATTAKTAAELEAERKRREEAEKRAAQANADLARIAAIKQEERGTVITPQAKLNQVAEALLMNDPESTFTVEGHTDSQGKPAFNQKLSEDRANAVRDYLVSHGIAADRITAKGYGSQRSVADNKSAEGRAENRRVEIVISPKKQ
jgi:outer membrane protein OmpA-like peptidoglycan-associated protein